MSASSPDAPPSSPADANGIIKIINDAVAEAGSSAAMAASEVEEAKRNARAASEVARKFMVNGGGIGGEQHQLHGAGDFLHGKISARTGSISNGLSPRRSFGVSPRSPHYSMNGEQGNNSRSSTPRSTGSTGFFRNRRKAPPSLNGGSGGGRSAMGHPPPSGHAQNAMRSADAEEMVALALELERAKQALEAEQMKHDETRSALQRASSKAAQLEGQMDQVLNDMETQRETLGRRVDSLEHELAHARMRLEAAEEDANLAFEIAKDNDERREEAERLLAVAQQEIDELKAQIAVLSRTRRPQPPPPPPHLPPPTSIPTPRSQQQQSAAEMDVVDANKRASPKVVRFADNDQSRHFDAQSAMTASTTSSNQAHASSSSPSSSRMDRSLVSSGREVLRQFAAGVDPLNVKDLSIEVLIERRRRLHDRMKSLDGHMGGSSPSQHSFSTTSSLPTFSPMASPLKDIETFLAASAESVQREAMIRGAVALLKASGRRLGLSGRWWNEASTEQASTPRRRAAAGTAAGTPESSFSDRGNTNHALALETLTRHYCTSVEVLLDRKQKEIVELESLCALWEDEELGKANGGAATR
jgi:hypothetical protein